MRKLVVVACCLAAVTASGGTEIEFGLEDQLKVGAHAGYLTGGDVKDPGPVIGVQATYDLMDYVSVELSVSRFADTMSYSETEGATTYDYEADITFTPVMLTLRGRYPIPGIEGLAARAGLGAGYCFADSDGSGSSSDGRITVTYDYKVENAAGVLVSLGAEYRVLDWLGVFADVGYGAIVYEYKEEIVYSGWWGSDTWEDDGRESYQHFLIRVGAEYVF